MLAQAEDVSTYEGCTWRDGVRARQVVAPLVVDSVRHYSRPSSRHCVPGLEAGVATCRHFSGVYTEVIHMCVCIYIYLYIYMCMYVFMYVCMYIYIYIYIYNI